MKEKRNFNAYLDNGHISNISHNIHTYTRVHTVSVVVKCGNSWIAKTHHNWHEPNNHTNIIAAIDKNVQFIHLIKINRNRTEKPRTNTIFIVAEWTTYVRYGMVCWRMCQTKPYLGLASQIHATKHQEIP